jgi:predicted O-methyltransferase YrrM
VARLHGLDPPELETARVVELGCGDGGNLLTVAAARPGAELLGIDVEPIAIERGRKLTAEAGLERVELRAADVRTLRPEDVGPADYVIVHGVWSWVPDDVREATLALAAAIVKDDGVISLTYNALPGGYLWQASRDIGRRAAAGEEDPERAAAKAIEAVNETVGLHEREDVYSLMLSAGVEHLRRKPPWQLFHDDLGDHCTPFWLSQVVQRAERHGLRYVGEVRAGDWWAWGSPPRLVERLRRDVQDPVARQEAADLASGVDFKATLFAPRATRPALEIDPLAALDLHLGHDPSGLPLPDRTPAVMRTLMDAIDPAKHGTHSRPLRELAADANVAPEVAADAACSIVMHGHALLRRQPISAAARAGTRPRAPLLTRAWARRSDVVPSLLHDCKWLEPAQRALVILLDGTRERDALPDALAYAARDMGVQLDAHVIASVLDTLLDKLALDGLLEA